MRGYDGRYEVSDQGRVRSWVRVGRWQADGWKRRKEPIIRSPHVNPRTGYLFVTLRLDGRYHVITVHKLVLEAFIGPRPQGMEACHNNGDRTDCSLTNLRWDTRSHNALDRTKHGTAYRRFGSPRDATTGRFLPTSAR